MIHVTPLSRLAETLARSGANRMLAILSPGAALDRPGSIAPENLLQLSFNDIGDERPGLVAASREDVARILAFAAKHEEDPLLIVCYAGISRSTAAAYIIAAAKHPLCDEAHLANELRRLSPSATPNSRMIALADAILERESRMVAAIKNIGRGAAAFEGAPFIIADR